MAANVSQPVTVMSVKQDITSWIRNARAVPKAPCQKGYFVSNSGCIPCPDKCASCSSPNECIECKYGFYGNLCDHKCSSGCKDDVCDMITGNCSCKETHVGHYCKMCVPRKFGHDCEFDCPKECLTCDINGNCTVCNTGYFGVKCKCSNRCLDNKCDRLTGLCYRCKPFFKWPCAHCVDGKYGVNCERDCPSNCLSCLSDTNCTKCRDGFYGQFCNLTCPQNCLDSCNSSGYCNNCKHGYHGKLCNKKCSKRCLQDNCFMNGNCAQCTAGVYGKRCEHTCPLQCQKCTSKAFCVSCTNGYFSHNCSKQCSYCKNNTSCNIKTGQCEHCSDGMYGSKCEFHKCPSNCFNVSCNADSGMCYNGCKKDYWGKYCNKRCPHNCLNNTCSEENGTCSHGCVNEYHGNTCECPRDCICNSSGNCSRCVNDNFYAPLCDQVCSYLCLNRTCDFFTGNCNKGCKLGYFGNKCNRTVNPNGISSSLLQPIHIVLLIVSLVILILVAVIMGIFLITSYITKQKELVTGSFSGSLTYRQVRRSQEILPSERNSRIF
ncbi:multiple epidermal growth factor-like domains protein 10 [Ruditapes philippinarum]|uniref:multiple epidermal growth factor-like domains protein 10 n=1 Tax=Ruditapes philippinarum TaxID=129788 RepID=UPI00295B7981|nr:multiple epidermal growth factor-like domains protein 10 [Ruditapes philippinarum]